MKKTASALIMKLWDKLNPVTWLADFTFIRQGLCENRWIWLHMLLGGAIARVLNLWTSELNAFLAVAFLAVFFEVIEFVVETPNVEAIRGIYGTTSRWLYDSLGDVLGALAIAALVLF